MKKLSIGALILSTLLLAAPLAAASTLNSMGKKDVIKAFSDKTFNSVSAVTLNNKIVDNTFTGYFSKDGKTKGKLKIKPEDGQDEDTGVWKVNDDGVMSVKWDHWNTNKEIRVNLYRLHNGFLIINSKHEFETMILDKDMHSGDSLK